MKRLWSRYSTRRRNGIRRGPWSGFSSRDRCTQAELASWYFAAPLEGVVIPESGDYEVRFFDDGVTLAATALRPWPSDRG